MGGERGEQRVSGAGVRAPTAKRRRWLVCALAASTHPARAHGSPTWLLRDQEIRWMRAAARPQRESRAREAGGHRIVGGVARARGERHREREPIDWLYWERDVFSFPSDGERAGFERPWGASGEREKKRRRRLRRRGGAQCARASDREARRESRKSYLQVDSISSLIQRGGCQGRWGGGGGKGNVCAGR